ncbi:MAG TPA: UvrD-helicase domain-containing protein [Streptosporangiaceae bacterium]
MKPSGERKPTEEQVAACDVFASGDELALIAGAGTGKTTTLEMMGRTASGERAGYSGIYMTFNRAAADDARSRFPRDVECSTAHSLAWRATGQEFKGRLRAPRIPSKKIASILGIATEITAGPDKISCAHQARLVMGMIRGFCYSDAIEVMARHMETVNGLSPQDHEEVARLLLPFAVKAWDDICSPSGRLPFKHDHYLKMWALTKPRLPCDFILLDEAQDTDPVVEEVFLAQDAQRVCVGDPAQQIYAWRSARDVMTVFPARHLYLTQAFRFGPRIAETANRWLEHAGSDLRLTGAGSAASRIGEAEHADAVLCRTNSDVMTEVFRFLEAGVPVAMAGGGEALRDIAKAASDLKAGRRTNHPELFLFSDWGEVQDYAENDTVGQELRSLVQLVDAHGPEAIIHAVERLSDERQAQVIVSTAHKAKGREWSRVRIGPGFRRPPADDDGQQRLLNPAEARLIYVAVTRARDLLDVEGVDWVDEYEESIGEPPSLINLSLTSQLKFGKSPVSLFMGEHLPEPHRVVRAFQQQVAGCPPPVQPGNVKYPAWSALGHAIDYRLRLFLGWPPGDPVRIGVEAVAGSAPLHGAPAPAVRTALGAAGRKLLSVLDDYLAGQVRLTEDQVCQLCFVAASFEDVYRTGEVRRPSMLADAAPSTTLREMAAAVPEYVPGDLNRQLELARPAFEWFRARPPEQITCGPVFTGSADIGGADADFILGGLLLDCKSTVTPYKLGTAEIYQLAGYLLLDYDDQYGIRRVGLYLSRQGKGIAWDVAEFLGMLGTTEPLHGLRRRFRDHLRGHQTDAPHGDG